MRVLAKFSLEKDAPSREQAQVAFKEVREAIGEWLSRIGDRDPGKTGRGSFNRRVKGSQKKREASRLIMPLRDDGDGQVWQWQAAEPYIDERGEDIPRTQFRTDLTAGHEDHIVAVHCVAGVELEQSAVRYLEPHLRMPPVMNAIINLGGWRVGRDDVVSKPLTDPSNGVAGKIKRRIQSRGRTLPMVIVSAVGRDPAPELRNEVEVLTRALARRIAGLGSVIELDEESFVDFSGDVQPTTARFDAVVDIHWPVAGRQTNRDRWRLSDVVGTTSDRKSSQRMIVVRMDEVQTAIYRQSRSLPPPDSLAGVMSPFGASFVDRPSMQTDIVQFSAQLTQLAQHWQDLQSEITDLRDSAQDRAREVKALEAQIEEAQKSVDEAVSKATRRWKGRNVSLEQQVGDLKEESARLLLDARAETQNLRKALEESVEHVNVIEAAYYENPDAASEHVTRSFGAIRNLLTSHQDRQADNKQVPEHDTLTTVESAVKRAIDDATSLAWGQDVEASAKDLHHDAGPPQAIYHGLMALDVLAQKMGAGPLEQGVQTFLKSIGQDASKESKATMARSDLAAKREFPDARDERMLMEWHVKVGYGRRDKNAPRIHFVWLPLPRESDDKRRSQVVVGYVGPHLETADA